MADKKSRGLGRGLSALMADVAPKAEEPVSSADVSRSDRYVPIELVFPNPDQPRRTFDEEKLDELTESIKSKGIFQPLIVRQRPGNQQQFEIVAGERRWRAAQRAKLHQVPVIVREFTDTEVLEIAIIETESDGIWLTGFGDKADIITLGQGFVRAGDKVEAVKSVADGE